MTSRQRVRWLLSWVLVRPRRWLFANMVWASCGPKLLTERGWDGTWIYPNVHWWILYQTVFRFFNWLNYDAWRPLCKWGRVLEHKPWYARVIHRIGKTTAGYAISGFECFHCASEDGCQVDLSDDDTGTKFRLLETWSVATMDGTDHRFRGITICPACGFEDEYEDGSL